MKAKDISRIISDHRNVLEHQVSQLNDRIMDNRQQILLLKREQAEIYQQMAKVLLLESPDVGELSEINQLLLRLKSELGDLNSRLQQLKNKLEQDQLIYDELTAQTVILEDKKVELLLKDKSFSELADKFTQAETMLSDAEILNSDIQAEVSTKLAEFDTHPIYHYLTQRHFEQPEYKGKWIFRHLDSWLARQVDYPRNRRNYLMLQSMSAEAERRKDDASQRYHSLFEKRQVMIDKAATQVGFTAVNDRLERIQSGIDSGSDDIKRLHETLRDNINGHGELFASISEKIASIMAQLPLSKLNDLVLKTESPQDDLLFKNLLMNKNKIAALENTITEIHPQWLNVSAQYDRIHKLNQEFIDSNLSASKYAYDIGVRQIESMLETLVIGDIYSQHFSEILRGVRYIPVSNSSSGSSSSGGGFFSSSSGGGHGSSTLSSSGGGSHRSSSSSGGGKFTTTDSF